MTLYDWIRFCRRSWVTIFASAVLFAAAAAVAAVLMRPVYRAQVVMMPAPSQDSAGGLSAVAGQVGGLASLAGLGGPGKSTKDQAIAVLRSRLLSDQFVSERHLLPVLFESDWDARAARWKNPDPAKQPTLGRAYKKLTEEVVDVKEDLKSGIITLHVDWTDREMAADWANDLVHRTNLLMRQRATKDADESIKYLTEQLARTDGLDLRGAIVRLFDSQAKSRMVATVTEEYAFRVIDPAVTPDVKDRVRPKRTLMVIFGAVAGAIVGLLISLYRRAAASAATTRD